MTHISYHHGWQSSPDVAVCSDALAPRVVWSLDRDMGSDHLPMLLEVKETGGGAKTRPKAKWVFPWVDWLAFREECEAAFAGADPEHTFVQDRTARFISVIQRARVRHIPRGARKDPKPWSLDLRLQEAVRKRREALNQLRNGAPSSKERWVEAKQHAARIKREVSEAHFREFVEKELNKPASLGRTIGLLKHWTGEDDHRPGEAMVTEDGHLLATDREKADAQQHVCPSRP